MREMSWDTFGVQPNTLTVIPKWVLEKINGKIMYSARSRLGEGIDCGVVVERDKHCVFIKDNNKILSQDRWYDLYVLYSGNCGTITLRNYETKVDGRTYKAVIRDGYRSYWYSSKSAEENATIFLYGNAYYYNYYAEAYDGNFVQMTSEEFMKETDFKDWLVKEFEEDMKMIGPSEIEKEFACVEVPFNA